MLGNIRNDQRHNSMNIVQKHKTETFCFVYQIKEYALEIYFFFRMHIREHIHTFRFLNDVINGKLLSAYENWKNENDGARKR